MSPRDTVYKDWTNDTFSELNRVLLLSNKGLLLKLKGTRDFWKLLLHTSLFLTTPTQQKLLFRVKMGFWLDKMPFIFNLYNNR